MARWKAAKLPGVGACGAVVIRDRVAGEKPGKHGADAVGGDGNSGLAREGGYAIGDGGGNLLQLRIDGLALLDQGADGGDSGGHGEGIAAERAGLIDRAERGEQVA